MISNSLIAFKQFLKGQKYLKYLRMSTILLGILLSKTFRKNKNYSVIV